MTSLDPQAIAQRLIELREKISSLQTEADELETTLRVIDRFLGRKTSKEVQLDGRPKGLGPKRPEGIPSNFEMVDTILKNAEREGKGALTATEIVQQIEKIYWPGVTHPQIASFVYSFGNKGRIRKTASGKFKSLSRNNEGSSSNEQEPL